MSSKQHDYVIDNASGAVVRGDINDVLQAIVSLNYGANQPTTRYPYQWWADTTTNILKIRNSGNTAWINVITLAGGIDVDAASNFNEDVTFTSTNGNNIVFDKSSGVGSHTNPLFPVSTTSGKPPTFETITGLSKW